MLDSAISSGKRSNKNCNMNINLFDKFKPHVDFIFRYENYSVHYIKQFCNILNVNLNNNEIIEIMKELDNMLHNKNIVLHDDFNNEEYRKTLLSQNHNTSDGKTNKFIDLSATELDEILQNDKILKFLEEQNYF